MSDTSLVTDILARNLKALTLSTITHAHRALASHISVCR